MNIKTGSMSGGSKHMPKPIARKTEVLVSSTNLWGENHRDGS